MRYPERRYGEVGGDALGGPRQTSGRRRPRPPPSSNRARPTDKSSDDERPIIIASNHHHRSVPPAFVIAPTVDNCATETGISTGRSNNNRLKSALFGLLVVGSMLYTDSPLAASARAVYSYASDTGTGNVGTGGVGTAPAFSTSHSREMKLFGGGDGGVSSGSGSGSGGSGALVKFEAATAAPPMTMMETAAGNPARGERAGGRGTGRKIFHTNAHDSMHRARRNGKRRPRLAHARDPTYTYEQPPVSSEAEGDSDAVPSMDRNLHPRERVLVRPTDDFEGEDTTDNNRDANHDGLSSQRLSHASGAEAASGRRRALSRFVFREEHPVHDATRQDVGGGDGDGGSNLVMTMVGIGVGLGAAVSLAVLLFLSDRPFQAKRQHGTTNGSSRAESFVVQHRRSTSGGSSSNTSTLSSSASLESIGEEEAGDDNAADEERGRVGVGIGVDGARRRR